MSKLPASCATCNASVKDQLHWYCDPDNDATRVIPCGRGKLPKPPKWCPLRGGKK